MNPGECRLLKGLALSIEMPAAVATLAADIAADPEAHERQREWIAHVACMLFAAGAVLFASVVAVLTQLP